MDPRHIFPAEIWERIFGKVKDAQDWPNLYRASSYFQELVGDKRSSALFPKVFPHLYNYLTDNTDFSEVLKVRSMARKWREGVDTHLEHSGGDEFSMRNYNFAECEQLASFLKKFEDTHRDNPIIGRRLIVEYELVSSEEEEGVMLPQFKNLLSRLMTQFGAGLRKLVITDPTAGLTSFDNFCHRLRNVVQKAPNLDSLKILVGTYYEEDNDNNGVLIPFTQAEPWPLIPNLKDLAVNGHGLGGVETWRFLAELQTTIVRMCCNPGSLKRVELNGLSPALAAQFPNLESAKVFLHRQEDLTQLGNASWPQLTQLTLSSESIDTRVLLNCAERFRKTLTSLSVSAVDRTWGKKSLVPASSSPLNLPRLKQLEIRCPVSFNILAALTNLERVSISQTLPNEQVLDTVSQIVKEEIRRSNIWEVLPKLRSVGLKGTVTSVESGTIRPFRRCYSRSRESNNNNQE